MIGALYTGASGLRAHLLKLDVISNNLANVNTIGFKAGRTTFEEALSRFISSARRADDDMGGINPSQIGTGVNVSSIDNIFTQGSLSSTGVSTDLAIQGNGFFTVRDTSGATYYTRNGAFSLDSIGHMVTADGLLLQGKMADSDGNITSGTSIENIVLPLGVKDPAKATTEAKFTCNLNMEENPLGTILNSEIMLGDALSTDAVNGLSNGTGSKMALDSNDTVTFTVNGTSKTLSYDISSDGTASDNRFHSLSGLAAELQSFVTGLAGHAADTVTVVPGTGAGADTSLRWTTAAVATTATFDSTDDILKNMFSSYNGTLAAGNMDSDNFLHTATGTDTLEDLYSLAGTNLGLAAGDTLIFSGTNGASSVNTTHGVLAATTLNTLCGWVETDFGITTGNASIDTNGQLVIEGDKGTDDALTASITEAGNTVFNSAMGLSQSQAATDITHTTSFAVYDSLGGSHTVTVEFQKDEITSNLWHWTASIDNGTILSGGAGNVGFNSNGSLASFGYTGGATAFSFDPENGATNPVTINFNAGTVGALDGITQFESPTTTIMSHQNGYTMGRLSTIAVNGNGEIIGSFTNGITRTLAEVSLANFTNPAGLKKAGNSLWQEDVNSGAAVLGKAGVTLPDTSISAGYLEQSNVDMANEFIEMIIAQRGFEANSKTISLGDTMLSELVNLKRT
ncbi:MAG: flagellar hook-basal body complex protein [bacterium]|nr:flagellar hook-basal body complex protein [bacterium]